MKKLIFLLSLFFAVTIVKTYAADTLHGQIVVTQNDASTYKAKVQLLASAATGLGTCNIVLNYNTAGLDYLGTYTFLNFTSGGYAAGDISNFVAGELVINTYLNSPSTNTQNVPDTGWIDLVEISWDVLDAGETAGLAFDEGNINWVLFTGNESDLFETGTFGDNNDPLPVSLLSFDVFKQRETSALLNWATASEENNKGFYIERSIDGRTWNVVNFVGTKAVNGNSQQIIRYSYTDENIFRPYSRNNTFYYRLRQQDYNGTEEYVGGVKAIRFGERTASVIQFSPNPATNYINIKSTEGGNLNAVITDLSGKQMAAGNFEGSTIIDVANLNAGLYIVTVKNASGEIIGNERLSITR